MWCGADKFRITSYCSIVYPSSNRVAKHLKVKNNMAVTYLGCVLAWAALFTIRGGAVFGQDAGSVETCTFDGVQGACVDFFSCARFVDLLKDNPGMSMRVQEYLKDSYCGSEEDERIKVCCPFGAEVVGAQPNNVIDLDFDPTHDAEVKDEDHTNYGLLPVDTCGPINQKRIVGGNVTDLSEFPFMVLISYNTSRGLDFQCGGTLINSRYVLTAAHCLAALGPDRRLAGVRVGEHDTRTDRDCTGPPNLRVCAPPIQDIEIDESIPHENFTTKNVRNDIGLIRLLYPADLSRTNARAVCLPAGRDKAAQLGGRKLTVVGWGVTENGRDSPVPLKVQVPIITNRACADHYNVGKAGHITDMKVCAGTTGKDSCDGDSGGPLLDVDDAGQRYVQRGIVSYGPRRCGSGEPAIYTRVEKHITWILDHIRP